MNAEKKQKLQEKYVEFQLLQAQIRDVQQQKDVLSRKTLELKRALESLGDIDWLDEGKKVFSQIGAGIHILTRLDNKQQVLVNVGAHIFVSKTITEAREFLERHIQELDSVLKNINFALEKAARRLHILQHEIVSLSKK